MKNRATDTLNNIKMRTIISSFIFVLIGVMIISDLPFFKRLAVLDLNFWNMIIDLIFLLWFILKLVKNSAYIKPLIDDYKTNVNCIEIIKIVFINILLSLGFIFLIIFLSFKISPDFCNSLLNEAPTDSESTTAAFFNFITVSFLAPVVEEFIFRGVILNRLKIRFGIKKAIILSSLVFCLLHYKLSFLGAFFFGIVVSLLYIKSGNILVNISAHFLNNFIISLVGLTNLFIKSSPSNSVLNTDEINICGAISIIILIISGFFTLKYIRKNWPRINNSANIS